MTAQLALVFSATLPERFERFHQENEIVYGTLLRLARQWKARHDSKVGIATLYETARWVLAFETDDPNFKLDNSYRAFYSRLLMAENPELAGLFDLRVSEADEYFLRRAQ